MKLSEDKPANSTRSLVIFVILSVLFVGGAWKLIEFLTRTPVEVYFKDKDSFGILLMATDKAGESGEKLTFLSVATIYPKTQRIGFISFLPETRLKEGEPALNEQAVHTSPRDLARDISELLGIPIPYHVKTTVENISKIVDLIEGVPFFMWSSSIMDGEILPQGEFNLTGSMVPRLLDTPIKNETKPAMDLFRYYSLIYNIWNQRDAKWNLVSHEKIFSVLSGFLETNLSKTELYTLSKKFGTTEGWHLTSIEIPVKRTGNGFLLDYESTALFLKNFRKDLTEHENPFLARMPRMEIKNGTEVANLAKKIQASISRKGVTVIEFTNADSHNYKKSIILDVAGNTYYLYSIAKTLGISSKYALVNKSSFTDMILILGKDYERIKLQ